jgi:hypothetical protein
MSLPSSHLQELSDEEIKIFSTSVRKIAEAVAKNNLTSVNNKINIVGPLASCGEKKNGIYIESGKECNLFPDTSKKSYLLNGLVKTKVYFTGKVNHILIRDCHDSHFCIQDGVISGVSILNGTDIVIELPVHNTTSIEQTSKIAINGDVTNESIIYVKSSQEIDLNNVRLPINPFIQGIINQWTLTSATYVSPVLQFMRHHSDQLVQVKI